MAIVKYILLDVGYRKGEINNCVYCETVTSIIMSEWRGLINRSMLTRVYSRRRRRRHRRRRQKTLRRR